MRRGLLIFALLIPGCDLTVVNGAFADLATDFLKQAPERWTALEQACRSLQIEADCTTTTVPKDGKETHAQERWLYRRNGPWQLIEKEPLDSDAVDAVPFSAVFARNSRYTMKITKDRGSSDWLISDATFDPGDREVVEMAVFGITQRVFDTAWALPFSAAATIVNSPNFKLISCVDESGPAQGTQLVKVDFDLHPTGNELKLPERFAPKALFNSISGTLVLDKEHYWAITGYDVLTNVVIAGNPIPIESRYKATAKYAPARAPSGATVPVPVQINLELIGAGGTAKNEVKVVESSLEDLPEKDFTLAAYGLPEVGPPSSAPGSGRSVATYIFLIASVLAIIALLLARNRVGRSELK